MSASQNGFIFPRGENKTYLKLPPSYLHENHTNQPNVGRYTSPMDAMVECVKHLRSQNSFRVVWHLMGFTSFTAPRFCEIYSYQFHALMKTYPVLSNLLLQESLEILLCNSVEHLKLICKPAGLMITWNPKQPFTSSARTSRGRKFPKGKELYSKERICL